MADGTLKVGTITNSAGSGNITIGSGVTLLSNTPSFMATSASTSLVTATHTTLINGTEDWDTNSLYDTSTGIFTVTSSTTGYYFFYATMGTAVITADRISINIFKNSTRTLTCETQSDSAGYPAPNVSGAIPLLTNGDYVYVQGYQNSGGTIALSGELNKNFFGGYKIGV
jgi:hypothetical protein